MRRVFNALQRKEARDKARLAGWEKTDPPRALVEYARCGDAEKVSSLLAKGVDPDAEVMIDITVDTVMETPLCAAASAGSISAARLLLDAGAQIDKRDDDGYTPLLRAAVEGAAEMVSFLLEKGADINARENIFDHTPLHKAARLGRKAASAALIAAGADQSLRDSSGKTAEETICDQCGYRPDDKARLRAEIKDIFAQDRARRAAAEKARQDAAAARALAISRAGTLQRDMPLPQTPKNIRKRGKNP